MLNCTRQLACGLLCLVGGACTLLSIPDVADSPVTAVGTSGLCEEHSDCPPQSAEQAVCIAGRCVRLTSEDCQAIVPEGVVEDGSVLLGWMGPLKGHQRSIGLPLLQGAQLALEEIDARANGLPLGDGTTRRKIRMVACHDLDDATRAANHLIDELKVPAILGPAFSGTTLAVATDLTIESGTLLLSASATSPAITDLQDQGLVWRTAPSDAIQAIPLTSLVVQAERHARRKRALDDDAPIRLAVVAKGEAYGQGLFDALTGALTFNGKTASANRSDFLGILYPDPATEKVDFSGYMTAVLDFEPDIVVLLGTAEVVSEVMVGLEGAWPTHASAPARPFYLFPDGGHDPSLLAAALEDPTLPLRVKGTVPGRRGPAYDAFVLRYKARFENAVPGTFAENAYDAAYLLAYTMLASAKQAPDGKSMAKGLQAMTRGAAIAAGPSDINSAIKALGNGGEIDFDGASGPLDFDIATGEAVSDIDIWCVVVEQGSPQFESSGEYYDAANGQLTGTNSRCEF